MLLFCFCPSIVLPLSYPCPCQFLVISSFNPQICINNQNDDLIINNEKLIVNNSKSEFIKIRNYSL